MDYKKFARRYLEDMGAFDKTTMYEGALGESAMELAETFSAQGHSGNSANLTSMLFIGLQKAYDDPKHKIWQEYWNSPEGKKLQEDVGTPGIMTNPTT